VISNAIINIVIMYDENIESNTIFTNPLIGFAGPTSFFIFFYLINNIKEIMYFNIVELIDILFSSSLIHTLVVVGVIYFMYEVILVKENENAVAKEVKYELDTIINNINTQIRSTPLISGMIDINDVKKAIYDGVVPNMNNTSTSNQIQIINDKNASHNSPIYKKLKVFFIILGSITGGLILLYNIGFRKFISYKYFFTELILSIVIGFIFIMSYQSLFVYQFVLRYIDYHIYDVFKNNLYYSDGSKVYY